MKTHLHLRTLWNAVLALTLLLSFHSRVQAAAPDLTAPGVIAALKADPNYSLPPYSETYNLGPTGLRGWIHISNGADGRITGESRQILVTVASTPGNAVLAVDDVILGAMAGSSGTVPAFTSDARKAFGVAIGDAEKTGAGNLRVKRWRAGTTTDENIPMTIMGDYTETAPYSCPKSALILANARSKLVSQLLANEPILTSDWKGAIHGLALLAGVAPGDANYAAVQTRLQTYARSLAPQNLTLTGCNTWGWGYIGVFLGEYYLSTGDANVVAGLNTYTVALAKGQSRYGTFGHGGSVLKADGSLHGTIPPYGPVNQAGIPANMAIVMGKKALLAAGQAIDPEIDPAIQRGSDFFAWYVNKGSIPYGEHEPWSGGHSSNGKDPACAVLFGLQAGRTVETEYFSRMTTAGFNGREYGHTGQGFSYLWGAMGSNMGGALAVAEYLKQVRWHLDLQRRTDGSFAYDSKEGSGGGTTADGTYLGKCGYYDMNPTACYILTYALPLQRLHITGKDANPANTLDAAKVADAIAAATFNLDCPGFTTTRLIAALGEFDPVVRNYAAIELAKRSLSPAETNTLLAMLTSTNANERMGACQTLGLLKNAAALPLITQRLDKNIETDSWVRGKVANAIRCYDSAAASTHRDSMLTALATNATDPEVIDWDDPIQMANSYLSFALFGGWDANQTAAVPPYTISAPKSLLYPAVQAGLKQPDSLPRSGVADFCYNHLTLADVQALIPDLIEVAATESLCDTMWHASPRASGINTLAKWKISDGIPLALAMQQVPAGFGHSADGYLIPALTVLAGYGDAARWTLPALKGYLTSWDPAASQYATLVSTIATLENAISAPTLVPGFPVAYSQVVATETAKAITLTGYDSAGDALTYAIVTPPAHGTLAGTPPNMTYTPAAGFYGLDRFTFKTTDGTGDSPPGTVSLIVGIAGSGLKGDYHNSVDFAALKLTRTDPIVNFDWAIGSPTALLAPDRFSVRWSGQLLAPETAVYRFTTLNSDGVRLWVNGVQVLSDYTDHPIRWNDGVSINLTAGRKYDLVMEYYENTGAAAAKLKWTGPSFAGDNGVIISKEWLYDGTPITNRPPVALARNVTLAEDTATAITLGGGDPFFDALTYTIVTPPAHGSLTGSPPNLTYTPAANFNGADGFTFTVSDGAFTSAAATVGLTITPVNDASLANVAATYAGYTATTATLNATLTCDEASYAVYAYWGTTDGGTDTLQWQNSALVGTLSNVTASSISQPVSGLTANTRYYFTFCAVSAAGGLWANNVLFFGPGTANDMLTFGLPDQPAIINGTAIAWPVLSSAVVSNLAPTFTLSPGATCNKASGSSQNFTSPVTYTVTAQDGSSKTYTVTVSQLPNASFSWNSTSSGNWSLASKWLNESGAAVAPATGGQTYYTLNFANTGTYTATHDLGAGFLLNRLNFSGPTATLAGTNSLAFSAWASPYGLLAPQINQNGSSAVTISTPITMTTDLTIGGTGSGQVTLTGLVGAGSLNDGVLTHTGPSTLYLNNANNGYPGGLVVSNSTLKATVGSGKAFGSQAGNWQGTRMKLINSTLQVVGGGWCSAGFDLSGANTITPVDSNKTFFLGGFTGSGLLNITGSYPIAFNGNGSTFSGDVRINQGAAAHVNCGGDNALGSGGTITMASPGGVNMGIESSNGASLDNYIRLDTNLTLSWTYNNMTFNFKRDISGPGGITKVYGTADAGTHLQLRGLSSTYSGGTVFKSGKLEVLGGNSLGSGPVTMGGKAASVPTHVVALVNLAPMTLPNNFILAGISEPSLTDLTAMTTFLVDDFNLEIGGNVSGTGGLLKTGVNKLTLSGLNTCSGPVKVQAGVLACTRAASLGQGALDITDGAKVQLDYEGTRQVAALTLNGGAALPDGTYGSSGSLAPNKDDSHFSGTGMVTVGPVAAATTVTTLALTNGANPSAWGTALTFTATVTGNAPTGTVTFYCDGEVIGTGVLNGSFQASATTSNLPQGWQYVTACYQGNSNNLLDISEPLAQYVGAPLPNAAPVATAQSVSTAEDTAKAITLQATDADGDALTYSIVTAPARGTLTGTAPNITYTPAANYNGSDSFAFRVNDGHVNSAVATVTLTVTAVSDAPVAFAQSVSVGINSAKAITLLATDADGGSLTYTIVSQPTHGTLGGTAPNVTYTPTTNYSGTDSFTFRASDGTNNSAVVAVSLTVTTAVFTWYSAVTGLWSDTGKWAAGSGSPASAGQVDYVLDFNKSGTYTATHDLSDGFLLNQLGFAGAVTLAGANSLVFSANGGVPPRIYQNSSSAVTISTPLGLASDVTLGGTGSGGVTFSGVISGTGSLVKSNTGTLTLSGVNNHSGGTVIQSGTLSPGLQMDSAFGSGPVTLNSGATLALNRNYLTNTMQLDGGTITSGNSFTSTLSGAITLGATSTFNVSGNLSLTGNLGGSGGLIKAGGSTVPVSGSNSFTGAVAVQAGTLKAASLNRVSGGSPTSNLGSPTTVADGTISLGAATTTGGLQYIGAGETTDRIINLAGTTGGATLDQSGAGGLLKFTSSLAVTGTGAKTLTLQGSTAGSGEFAGMIGNSSGGATALTKSGAGTWTISGVNSYSGVTKVTAGMLTCGVATSLGGGPLDITTGAKLNLDYVGTRQVAALTFNAGSAQPNGTYGSSFSPATYQNDTCFAGSGTVTVGPVTGLSTTTLALTGGSTPSGHGTPLTFSATVAGSTPTGSVAFYADGTPLGTAALNGSFQASLTTSSLAAGTYRISAQYAGDAINPSSTSAAMAIAIISVVPPPPTALAATPGNSHIGLTWTASTGATGYHVKRSLIDGGPYAVIGNPNTASYDDLTAANGTTYYYVVSALNAVGESANSSQVSGTPAPAPSTTTLVSSPVASGPYGTAVTFTATVTTGATGLVTFNDGATVLGTGTLTAGTATFDTSTLAVANHSITATYGGDATFAGSVSAPAAYLVTPISLTITGVTANDKDYDGTTTAVLTGGALSGGVLGSETVTVVAGGGTFASPNAGTWAVTATGYALGGAYAGNYVLSAQPTVPNATITPRPVVVSGTRTYDATANVAAANLTISNKVGGDDLTLTGGTTLTSKDVGTQALMASYATPIRVRNATGAGNAATFNVTVTAPANGNSLVAVISTRRTSGNAVSNITQTGATWSKAVATTGTAGSTTDIWYAPNVTNAGTTITITLTASARAAVVVAEYSGVLTANPLDQTANTTGNNGTPVTGTTPATIQAEELWIGGIGLVNSTYTYTVNSGPLASFANKSSTSGTASNNARIYALDHVASATGTASSGGTSTSANWSGAIATFKAASLMNLALSGDAAANYTLTGLTGAVAITPKPLTVTGLTAGHKVYDGTVAAVLAGTAAFLTPEAAGAGSSGDGKPYTVDVVTPDGTAAGAFADPTVGTAKAVAVTGVSVTGGGSGNYTVTQPVGLTANLTARELTITANHQSKTYGQTLTFGSGSTQFTSSGLQNGETIGSVTLACSGGDAAAEAAGSPYPITPGAATGGTFTAGNYTINYVAGLLTVTKAVPTITTAPTATDLTYGQTLASSTLSGGAASVAGAFAFTVPATAPSAGTATHSVTFTPADTDNYQTATTNVNVTVTKAVPTITTAPTATDLTYGQTLASSTLSGGAASVAGAFAFTTPATAPSAGTATHSVTFTPADTDNYQTATTSVSVTVNAAQSPYSVWAADPAQGLTVGVNDGPDDDPDHDGVSNLLEFVLGGAPMVSSRTILPALTKSAGAWVFEYERSDVSLAPATTQIVEYGGDLTGWTPIAIPEISNTEVIITPGSPSDHVKVTIPVLGTKVFVRLKVTQ